MAERPEVSNGGYENIDGAWVHVGAKFGRGVVLEPGALIGDQVSLGDGCWIGSGAVIKGPAIMGANNRVFPTAVIGEAPQDLSYAGEPTRVEIGDNNVFRELVTVNRGSVKGGGVTRIGNDNFLMAACHIAHDCALADKIVVANHCLIAGHCHIHSNVTMSGFAGIGQFTTIGRFSFLGGNSGSNNDCPPFMLHDSTPSRPKGVNSIGLKRAGFAQEKIDCLKMAYRLLFTRSSSNHSCDLELIREELQVRRSLTVEVEELLTFMESSKKGKSGRMIQI